MFTLPTLFAISFSTFLISFTGIVLVVVVPVISNLTAQDNIDDQFTNEIEPVPMENVKDPEQGIREEVVGCSAKEVLADVTSGIHGFDR